MALAGLKLGGEDKNPATPPSGPADSKLVVDESKVADDETETAEPEVEARWSSHPIMRYTIGKFSFENGLLVLRTEAEIAEFQELYDTLPIYEQVRIKKVDVKAAEALVREMLANNGGATQAIDSSVGDRAPSNQTGQGTLTGEN